MKKPPYFYGGIDSNTIFNFVYMVDMYFGLIGIINEQTRQKFASLLLIDNAANWYDSRYYTSNATWGTLKNDFLPWFKSFDFDRLKCEALDRCRQQNSDVSEYIKALVLALLRCDTYISEEESLHRFQQGLWDKVKVQVLIKHPAIFEAAGEIADHIGMILAHTQFGKGLKKTKSKGKNPYYILYHHADVVGGDTGLVPMELGKTTL